MNRNEHLQWCKDRALEYVDNNDNPSAMASMCSDLTKHEELKASAEIASSLGLIALMSNSSDEMRKFINGFN